MRCLIGIDDKNLIKEVEGYLNQIGQIMYIESTSNLETVQQLLLNNDYDFMIASCCQHKDYSQKLLGWIRVKNIDIEVIYVTEYKDAEHIQKAFRYGVCDYLLLPLNQKRFKTAIRRAADKILFMNSQNSFSQNEIDDYMSLNVMSAAKKQAPSKGINTATFTRIQKHLGNINTPFTAEQLAQKVDLSRITVRRYLEKMVEDNQLDVKLEYGNIGRPYKLYKKKDI